jgi:uncharacterized repeat protein (TIGR01451 family)
VHRARILTLILACAVLLCLIAFRHGLTQSTGLRRITNTTEEGINLNPSISGDGRTVAFESTEDIAGAGGTDHFRAIRVDIAGDPPAFFQMAGSRAVTPAISQDGSRIAFASKDDPLGTNLDGNSEIFLFDGAKLNQITNTSPGNLANRVTNGNFQPSISDDGRFIAFSSNHDLTGQNADGNLEIFVYDANAASFTQLTNSSGTVGSSDAKLSGDGSAVAFIRDTGASPSAARDLVRQPRVGPGATIVLGMNVQSLAMTYGRAISDDGSRVVYAAQTATNTTQVFLYDGRAGGITRQITSLGARVTEVPLHPTISGDGSRIAFAARRSVSGAPSNSDGGVELYVYDLPTSTFSRITNAPSSATGDLVSSLNDDGSIVAFNFPRILSGAVTNSGTENNSEIYATGPPTRPANGTLTAILNDASFGHEPSAIKAVAPDSIAAAQGTNLANTTMQSQRLANGTFPTNLAGTRVTVNGRTAQIFFVSPTQVNFLVPPQTEIGTAEVIVTNAENFPSRGNAPTLRTAPGVFTKTGDGIGEGQILNSDTLQEGPFDPTGGNLRLSIFTTGVRNAVQTVVSMGGRVINAESVMPSPDMPGLDEVHVRVPSDLRGTGTVNLSVIPDGRESNRVSVNFLGDPGRAVFINEVLADPPDGIAGDANHDGVRDSMDDEFVELVNGSGGETIGMGGWMIKTRATGSTTETTRFTFAAGTSLPAGAAIAVFGGGTFNPTNPIFGCAQVVKATSSAGLSLTNGGLTILVRDGSGNLIAQFSYGGSTGLEGDNNQSLTRSPDITGSFIQHTAALNANGSRFSPGLRTDGTPFRNCPGHLTSVTISPSSTNVAAGQTTQFTSQAFDEYGRVMTGVTINFNSDNAPVATVDSVSMNSSTGVATATVTGRNQGTAHIQASATRGGTTVNSPQATLSVIPRVSRVELSPASATINRGNTQQFNATAFDQNNQPLSGVTFTWSASNTSVATIDSAGLARGAGIGGTTITASTPDGNGGIASATATLNAQVPLVINEINADVAPDNPATTAVEGDANRDGVRDSGDDEFVELLNNSGDSVDLSGVVIADATSNRFTFPANTTLAAGRAVVIFGGGSPPANDPAFGGALILATSSLSLNDTGDTVNVKLSVGGSDVAIATQSYGSSSGVTAPSDQALTRSADAAIGASGGSFVAHNTATNASGRIFSPGTRADGTPFGSPALSRIEVTPASPRVNVGATQAFTAKAFSNAGGPEIEIQNVSFIWDSRDTSKATLAPATGQTTTTSAAASGDTTTRARAGSQQATSLLSVNPTLSINDISQNEGNSGPTTFTFTISLSTAAPAGGVTFDITTQDGTATVADNDYVSKSLTSQTIPPGSQTYMFDLTVNGDATIEPNETFSVNVTNVTGATIADGQGQGTIRNDDSATLSIGDVSANEGNTGTTTFAFTVSSSLPAPAGGITFDITTQDNSAISNGDYVTKSLTGQTIPPGQQTYTFDVTVNGDTLVEPDETFLVKVTSAANGSPQATGTIRNDDVASLVISQVYGGGNNSGAPLRNDFVEIFNRGTATIDFSITPYSVQYASLGSNFGSSKTNLTTGSIAPGKYFLVQESGGTTNGVALPTPDATGSIAMAGTSGKVALVAGTNFLSSSACPGDDSVAPFNPVDASIADFVGYGDTASTSGHCYEGSAPAAAPSNTAAAFRKAGGCTDTNQNGADFFASTPSPRNSSSPANNCAGGATPNLSVNDVTVTEGNSGTTTATFTVTLSAAAQGTDVIFDIATQDNTATTANSDYVAKSLTNQIIPAGQTTYTFSVTVNGLTTVEADETFFVNVSNVVGAAVTDGQGVGTIQHDDLPTLSIDDVSTTEGDSGTKSISFHVSLSAAAPETVTFDIATADGTARDHNPVSEDNDYQARSLTAQTIAQGSSSFTFDVTVNGDLNIEPNETFFVNVTNVSGASILDGQGAGTIQNDDAPPVLSINDVTQNEGNAATSTFSFTVQLSAPAKTGGVTFDIATQNDTAAAGSDYVAKSQTSQNIPEGSQIYTFDVTVNGDTVFEPNESFFVNVTKVSGATVGDAQGVGTITNDDAQPTITITNASITEGNSGTSLMAFTVTLNGTSQSTVSVDYATADSSATVADSDYDSATGTINFAPGDTSKTFTVTIHGDTNAEGDEMFLVNLSSASGATVADNQALGTIFLDDPFSIAAVNTMYPENFDGLAQSGASSTTPTAWTRTENGSSANSTYTANNGGSTTGDTYSYGTTGAADRALGALRTGSLVPTIGAFYRNDTGVTINTLQINYTGEEWRLGTASRTDRLDFQYSTDATSLTTGTWTDVDALDFTTPNTTTTGAKDGNNATNRTAISNSITGLSIAPGVNVWIRWTDFDATGSDDGLAVDDFSITAGVNTPALSIHDVTQTEGDAGTTTFNFLVDLSSPAPPGGVSFTVNTADGTTNPATAGSDYVAIVNGSGSIAQNGTSTTVRVTVNGDMTVEPDETFFVNITNVSGAAVADGQGVGTITNDDAVAASADLSVTKAVNSSTPNIGENVLFTVTLNNSGPDAATGVQVKDLLPAGLTYVSSTASQGTYTSGTGIWNVATVSVASPAATLTITATVMTTGAKTNTAEVTASGVSDPDSVPNDGSGDDFASVTVTGASNLVINEVVTAPPSSSPPADANDFVELYNKSGTHAIDISGLVISSRASASTTTVNTFTLPGTPGSGTTVIQPNSYLIIVNGTSAYGTAADFDASASSFNLTATSGGIKIELNGVKLDGLAYQSSAGNAIPATFLAFGEGTPFTSPVSSGLQDYIRSPNGTDTNDNASDFRRNGTTANVSEKAANPTIP